MSTSSNYNSSIATDPLRGFRFTANFSTAGGTQFDNRIVDAAAGSTPGVGWSGGFTNVSGLSIATQAIAYREGGYNTTVHQIPGMTTFTPITFTRGVMYGNDQAMVWMRGLFSAAAGAGLLNDTATGGATNSQFRLNIDLAVNDHPNTSVSNDLPKMVFRIHNAWITALNYTDLDSTNGAVLFESMQVVHEGLSVMFTKADGTKTPVDPAMASAIPGLK